MRIIFESERTPVTATIPSDAASPVAGTTTDGVAWLCIRTFDDGEVIPKEYDHARPVARVLERLASGEPHRSPMPSVFAPLDGRAHEVTVPRSVLTSIAPDTIVGIDWEFQPVTSARSSATRPAASSTPRRRRTSS
jgi:hypothetical protein